MTEHEQERKQVILQLAASDLLFDRWFRQHLQEVHGLDVTQPKAGAPSNEMIFVWQTA